MLDEKHMPGKIIFPALKTGCLKSPQTNKNTLWFYSANIFVHNANRTEMHNHIHIF